MRSPAFSDVRSAGQEPLDERLSCGVRVIDDQHRRLLVSLRLLQDQVGVNASRSTLAILMADFVRDVDLHFKTEEALIEIIDSGEARSHAADHAQYLRQIEKCYTDFVLHGYADWPDILPRMATELEEHIYNRDIPLYREVRLRLQQPTS